MFTCFVFFSNPALVGKFSNLVTRINPDIKVIKVLDAKQINFEEYQDLKPILITNLEQRKNLEEGKIDESKFAKIISVDDGDESIAGNVHSINQKFIITGLGKIIDDYIVEVHSENRYVPVQIQSLDIVSKYPCDIFVQLSKTKHIKILNAGECFSSNALQKLTLKNVKFLHIQIDAYSKFIEFIQAKNEVLITQPDPVGDEISAIETIHDYMNDLGFSPKVIEMTKALHNNIETKFTNKFMKGLLSKFKDMEGTYLYNHSYLASVIALTAAKKYSWMNHENEEKIYLGCILHDMGFNDKKNALKEIMGLGAIKDLSKEDKDDILNHPTKFAKHLAQVEDIHPDVLKIVKNHHGIYGEDSYPQPLYAADVNFIFALFAMSHEMTIGLYKIMFNEKKIPKLLDDVCELFDRSTYRKILPEFRASIEETFLK